MENNPRKRKNYGTHGLKKRGKLDSGQPNAFSDHFPEQEAVFDDCSDDECPDEEYTNAQPTAPPILSNNPLASELVAELEHIPVAEPILTLEVVKDDDDDDTNNPTALAPPYGLKSELRDSLIRLASDDTFKCVLPVRPV